MADKTMMPSEILRLASARTENEWNDVCNDVKRRCGGAYPGDWYAKVIRSGLLGDAQARFG